jgi:endonuclease/exonuclease/phosphatase family metal-dependent hydrolase
MRGLLLVLLIVAFSLVGFRTGETMYGAMNATSVMTYDIHMEGCGHHHPSWMERRSMVAQVIRLKSPEILGLQGTSVNQLAWLKENLIHYGVHYPKSMTHLGDDVCPILHDSRIYSSIEEGTYVIDDLISAKALAKDSSATAPFLNWVKLEHIPSKRIMYVVNTSLGSLDTQDGKPLAITKMQSFIDDLVEGNSFVLLGNLASEPESPMIVELSMWAQDSNVSSLVSISAIEDTQLGWEKCDTGKRVDYVFLSKDIPANSHEVVDIAFQNKFPSDHLPVFCRVRLN